MRSRIAVVSFVAGNGISIVSPAPLPSTLGEQDIEQLDAQTQTAKPLIVALEEVQRVEILYFPERVLVRAALSPERLEQLYQYKLEIRDVRESAEWQRLPPLLRETSVKPAAHAYDHRTAVLLFDKDGRRIASVYFDQFGTGGTINGESGTISGGIYRWAKSLLKGVAG